MPKWSWVPLQICEACCSTSKAKRGPSHTCSLLIMLVIFLLQSFQMKKSQIINFTLINCLDIQSRCKTIFVTNRSTKKLSYYKDGPHVLTSSEKFYLTSTL